MAESLLPKLKKFFLRAQATSGEWVHLRRLGFGAFDLVAIAVQVVQEPFGHLGAGRVVGADE